MTRDEIAQLMNETAGLDWGTESHFQRFAVALIAAAEREACAQIFDEHSDDPVYCGQAIRARGKE
jgi:hypothetical protein